MIKHPVTPPRELVEQLRKLPTLEIITKAYQAGADQELEACVDWMRGSLTPSIPRQAADQLRCVELIDCLKKADWPHRYKVVFQQWMDIAHAALAEPKAEGPTNEQLNDISARRPKPPSLKERLSKAIIDGDEKEALKLLEQLDD